MTTIEFKFWFEGFTETMSGVPTKAQWARVKERVAEIDDKPIVAEWVYSGAIDRTEELNVSAVPGYRGGYYLLNPRQGCTEEVVSALGRADFDGIN